MAQGTGFQYKEENSDIIMKKTGIPIHHTFHIGYFEFCNKKKCYKLCDLRFILKLFLTDEASWGGTNLGKSSHDGLVSRKVLLKDHRLSMVPCEFSWIIKVQYSI